MFRAREAWCRLSRIRRERPFCTNRPSTSTGKNGDKVESDVQTYTKAYNEALKQLENPDFMTAAKLFFTIPPKRKKFGLDFHLVQFFFTCLPSLAIYLVAQYARSEMKRMDAELEVKRKREEEEENEKKRKEVENNPVLVEVRGRLDKLEEVIKEIAKETKKRATGSGSTTKDQDDGGTKTQPTTVETSKAQVRSEASNSVETDHPSRPKSSDSTSGSGQEKSGLGPGTKDAPQQDNKGTIQSAGSSEDSKNQRKPV